MNARNEECRVPWFAKPLRARQPRLSLRNAVGTSRVALRGTWAGAPQAVLAPSLRDLPAGRLRKPRHPPFLAFFILGIAGFEHLALNIEH